MSICGSVRLSLDSEREIGQNACSGGGLQKRPAAQALGTN